MSQIRSQSVPSAVEPGAKPQSRQAISKVGPQERRDFAAALRRAGRNEPDSEDSPPLDRSDPLDQPDRSTPNLMTVPGGLAAMPLIPPMPPMPPIPPDAMAAQAASANVALGGGAMTVLPNKVNHGTLPDAVPMTAGTISTNSTDADDQQWHINIPANDPASVLAVRLSNAGTGQWQVRLAADSATRLQLTPSLGRLRDKLRQRSGECIEDLEFEDDIGMESHAEAQTQL